MCRFESRNFRARGKEELVKEVNKVSLHFCIPLERSWRNGEHFVDVQLIQSNLKHKYEILEFFEDFIGGMDTNEEFIRFHNLKKKSQLMETKSRKDTKVTEPHKEEVSTLEGHRVEKKAESSRKLSQININIIRNKCEVLFDATHSPLHMNRARMGSIQNEDSKEKKDLKQEEESDFVHETLATEAILESGILERANETGKLYVWDPF